CGCLPPRHRRRCPRLHPAINRMRKDITGDLRTLPICRLLLKDSSKLDFYMRAAINKWLVQHPALAEVYQAKEALHRFYRTRGYHRAKGALNHLLDRLGRSSVPEIKTFRRTL